MRTPAYVCSWVSLLRWLCFSGLVKEEAGPSSLPGPEPQHGVKPIASPCARLPPGGSAGALGRLLCLFSQFLPRPTGWKESPRPLILETGKWLEEELGVLQERRSSVLSLGEGVVGDRQHILPLTMPSQSLPVQYVCPFDVAASPCLPLCSFPGQGL